MLISFVLAEPLAVAADTEGTCVLHFFLIMWLISDKFFPSIQVVIADNDKNGLPRKSNASLLRDKKLITVEIMVLETC